jgi:hypothetical protein
MASSLSCIESRDKFAQIKTTHLEPPPYAKRTQFNASNTYFALQERIFRSSWWFVFHWTHLIKSSFVGLYKKWFVFRRISIKHMRLNWFVLFGIELQTHINFAFIPVEFACTHRSSVNSNYCEFIFYQRLLCLNAVELNAVLWSVVAMYRKWPFSAPRRTKTP